MRQVRISAARGPAVRWRARGRVADGEPAMREKMRTKAYSDRAAFWRRMSAKLAVAVAVCFGVGMLLAQEPAPPPAASGAAAAMKAPELKDGNGFKYLGLPKNFPNSKAGKSAAQKFFNENVKKVIDGQAPFADSQSAFTNFY